MSPSYVEFTIENGERFDRLCAVFAALKAAKSTDEWRDEHYWTPLFDDRAKAHFWWPTDEQVKEWERRWFSTPIPERWTDPSLKAPWLLMSMIRSFENGDYELVACERLDATTGRLTFVPLAYPFGGTGGMVALIEAFEGKALSEHGT